MRYEYNEKAAVKALADLRESVGRSRMEREYESPDMTSYFHIAAYENHEMVGYIDCVSNGVTDACVQDLMVHPACQGRGLRAFLSGPLLTAGRIFDKV